MDELPFLILIRDKIDLLIQDVSIKEPLIEVSAMLTARIRALSVEGGRN